MALNFRTLKETEIDVRIASTKEKGLSLLLYKDARVDMNILDETVGSLNWTREHIEIKGNLFCKLSIYDTDKKEWVYKIDCGTESNADKEKGESSDSFKRAAFNWGIGRELYTSPFIWIKSTDCNISESVFNGKKVYKCFDKFEVEKILYDEQKTIIALSIKNKNTGKRVFVMKPPGVTK